MLSTVFLLYLVSSARALSHSHKVPGNANHTSSNSSYLTNHPYIPAVLIPNASRSPCPMLNTLANHAFLPRTGRNITKAHLNSAQVTALNMTAALASKTTNAMVAKLGSPKNASATFDLSDFDAHDFTEHDASLTRLDRLQGDTTDVQPSLVELLLADSETGWVDAFSIGRSRARREAESRGIGSPRLSEAFVSFAQLEASFILLVFGVENGTGVVRRAEKEMVRKWLNEERFPVREGFVRSERALTVELQSSLIEEIKESHDGFVGEYV